VVNLVQEVENKIKTADEKLKDKPNDLDPKKWRDYEKQGLQFSPSGKDRISEVKEKT
jgi:hypothetical protein